MKVYESGPSRGVRVSWTLRELTVTDIITAYTLDWATMYGWLADFPTLTQFTERMFARPAAPMRMAQAFAAMHR